jgi:hypothetical protein
MNPLDIDFDTTLYRDWAWLGERVAFEDFATKHFCTSLIDERAFFCYYDPLRDEAVVARILYTKKGDPRRKGPHWVDEKRTFVLGRSLSDPKLRDAMIEAENDLSLQLESGERANMDVEENERILEAARRAFKY